MSVRSLVLGLFVLLLVGGAGGIALAWDDPGALGRIGLGMFGVGALLFLLSTGLDLYLSFLPYPLVFIGAWLLRRGLVDEGTWGLGTFALLLLWVSMLGALLVANRQLGSVPEPEGPPPA